MSVRPFSPCDLRYMAVQPQQYLGAENASDEQLAQIAQHPSETLWIDGRPVLCGGAVELWAGRFVVWAYVSEDAGPHMRRVHRETARFLDDIQQHAQRIETAVACDFAAAHRWARMLGFRIEAERMRAYSPFGEDHALYARVREH